MKKRTLLLPLAALLLFSCNSGSGNTSNTGSKENPTSETPNTTETNTTTSENTTPTTTPATMFLVGDSTVCSFEDATYYYPRYGYGTQIGNYFNSTLKVENLALSGRSSKSFISEENYTALTSRIKKGDYLMIGFGHNDEKNDDPLRFTNPNGGVEDETSFKHYLYTYYIKVAQDKGATPILCTPVMRANPSDDYTGSSAHVTDDGDYVKCIKDLGTQYNVTVVDLAAKTKTLYETIGYDEAINYHAWTINNKASVDKTHLNIFGAKNVAYMFAEEIKNSSNTLKDYVLENITAPTKEKDLVSNPNFVESTYTEFNGSTYVPESMFANFTSEGWYGTAFGDTGGAPNSSSNGYLAQETAPGVFKVGQTGTASPKGKITSSSDGFAFAFRQVSVGKNFTITVDMKVLTEANVKQAGFGLMLRDDVYVNQVSSNPAIKSNYVAAGLVCSETSMNALFRRENATLAKESNVIQGHYAVDDVAKATITRVGQSIETKFVYKDVTYTQTYYDFDLVAVDQNYFYVGMFATRGTTIECTNVNFEITGDAAQA